MTFLLVFAILYLNFNVLLNIIMDGGSVLWHFHLHVCVRVCVQAVSAHPNVMGLRRVVPAAVIPQTFVQSATDKQVFLLELEYCSGGDLFGFVLKV